MANDPIGITVLSRNDFNNISTVNKASNTYLVQEGNLTQNGILSLYVGNAKKSDICEIPFDVIMNYKDPSNTYDIPEKYRIKNKLYYYKQSFAIDSVGTTNDIYRVVICDGERFLDVFSKENNVVICTSLPTTGTEDFVYMNITDKSIYVYHNGEFIELVSDNIYATVKDVSTMYNRVVEILNNL